MSEEPVIDTLDSAWAVWLAKCDSGLLSEGQRAALNTWVRPIIAKKANSPNLKATIETSTGQAAPIFTLLEAYCQEYPINRNKPRYKQVLRKMAANQGPAKARYYSSTFFKTIGRRLLDEDKPIGIPLPMGEEGTQETEDAFLSRVAREQAANEISDEARFLLDEGHMDEEACEQACKKAFERLTFRQKLIVAALREGIPASNPGLLKLADCQKSISSAEFRTAAATMNAIIHRELGENLPASVMRKVADRMSDIILSWKKSENLDFSDFLSSRAAPRKP